MLILVEADRVVYSKNDRPAPLVLFQVVKSMITGDPVWAEAVMTAHIRRAFHAYSDAYRAALPPEERAAE